MKVHTGEFLKGYLRLLPLESSLPEGNNPKNRFKQLWPIIYLLLVVFIFNIHTGQANLQDYRFTFRHGGNTMEFASNLSPNVIGRQTIFFSILQATW